MRGATILGILVLTFHHSSSSRILATLRKGLIPVQFTQYGQLPGGLPIINLPPKPLPLLQKPPVKLPAALPPPKMVRHMFQCLKALLRPQYYHQMVVVPQLRRYLRSFQPPAVDGLLSKRSLPLCPYCQ